MVYIPIENSNLLHFVFSPQMLHPDSNVVVYTEPVYDIPSGAVMSWWSDDRIRISPLPRYDSIYCLNYATYSQLCSLF